MRQWFMRQWCRWASGSRWQRNGRSSPAWQLASSRWRTNFPDQAHRRRWPTYTRGRSCSWLRTGVRSHGTSSGLLRSKSPERCWSDGRLPTCRKPEASEMDHITDLKFLLKNTVDIIWFNLNVTFQSSFKSLRKLVSLG